MKPYVGRRNRRALKIALVDADMRQRELARLTGIVTSTLSRIVNGDYPGTVAQQQAIAKALRRNVYELFPDHPFEVKAS